MSENDRTAMTRDAGVSPERRARGRPRSVDVDRAILAAAANLLDQVGYAGLAIEQVARDARVGKTSIYRRYAGKAELAAAVFASVFDEPTRLHQSNDFRTDLIALIGQSYAALAFRRAFSFLGTLLAEEPHRPELMEAFRQRVINVRRARARQILARAVNRGEARADVDPDAVIEALIGTLLGRRISGVPEPPDWVEQVVDLVIQGVAPRP